MTLYIVSFEKILVYMLEILHIPKYRKISLQRCKTVWRTQISFGHLNLVFCICLGFSVSNLVFVL